MWRSPAARAFAARCAGGGTRRCWWICSWGWRTIPALWRTFLTRPTACAPTTACPPPRRIWRRCAAPERIKAPPCWGRGSCRCAPWRIWCFWRSTAPAARTAACRPPSTCWACPTPAATISPAAWPWTRPSPSDSWMPRASAPPRGTTCATPRRTFPLWFRNWKRPAP